MFSANFPEKDDIEDVIKHSKHMSPFGRRLISEVGKILELLLVLPATKNATSERTFSKLKLIKTYLYSTMTQNRLNT